ncbi:malto-oligosyltrehalose synthase [Chitinophaga filiformis]|uniref:Maltooligosyl trehalose synthase n=1 Tax=Chitinophaga filiformis TaxID=104663 RepID=A0A1G7RYI2_CHIFI|nr:malto-oligosyltrehalose synthase [Chitinophaga filiformis]SDG15825.1 maltooligosyl trehalose synthase [Chitinophaga filiformis]
MKSNNPPSATYRLQLHAGFTFEALKEILDYLHLLGISTVYASPIFTSTPGSMHGYDVTEPHQINPAIGTIGQLREIKKILQRRGMSWLQDIVPNHMAFHPSNTRLYDVMERGPLSPYSEYFDIDWQHPAPELSGKVMAPFLGKALETCIADDEIKLVLTDKGYAISYFEQEYPLSASAYDVVQSALMDSDTMPVNALLDALYQQAMSGAALNDWQHAKHQLYAKANRALLEGVAARVNDDRELLKTLMQQQYYHLCNWQEADKQINYRRFFTVNELITLRMESPAVFDEYHTFLHSLYREELIQGLRIDHIDGLRDPAAYIERLRMLFGSNCYIVAEKILEHEETLPSDWALQGTSGYEFLSITNHLLTNPSGEQQLQSFYHELLPDVAGYNDVVYEKKRLILERYMGGEWENLVRYCYTLKLADARTNREHLKEAIALFIACLPIYRLYPSQWPLDDYAQEIIRETFVKMRSVNRVAESEIALLESLWEDIHDADKARNRLLFLQRLMQFTGPVTAKGVEDTTFYVYNALLSHNEVGDSPAIEGFSVNTFHQRLIARQQHTASSLNATSTHDTKRGEDGRIRLNMLSLMPDDWRIQVEQWRELNRPYVNTLTHADEYFIYQSIIAGFPANGIVTPEYIERLQQYFIKAVREAKVNTSWASPEETYENNGVSFIQQILTDEAGFVKKVRSLLDRVNQYAFISSLAQVLIKITAPGIPDIYQGCELWDYSYVDPDNRRPIDYTLRKQCLETIIAKEKAPGFFPYLAEHRQEGLEKLFVTWKALNFRREHADLLLEADYIPLQCSSAKVAAYARVQKQQWVIVIIPLPGEPDMTASVLLPTGAPAAWRNIFTDEMLDSKGQILVADVFKTFPVGLLTNEI